MAISKHWMANWPSSKHVRGGPDVSLSDAFCPKAIWHSWGVVSVTAPHHLKERAFALSLEMSSSYLIFRNFLNEDIYGDYSKLVKDLKDTIVSELGHLPSQTVARPPQIRDSPSGSDDPAKDSSNGIIYCERSPLIAGSRNGRWYSEPAMAFQWQSSDTLLLEMWF